MFLITRLEFDCQKKGVLFLTIQHRNFIVISVIMVLE